MSLPKLNNVPKYEVTIPSTGQKVKYRPYLIKEEKILLIAMESKDQVQALSAIVDTITACIHDKIDNKKLTTFDVEYLFLKIRSKSVGEKSNITLACPTCKTENKVVVDLDSIKIDVKKLDPIIKLTDKISLKMKWPSYNSVATNIITSATPIEQAFAVVEQCIETIQTEEENFFVKDLNEGELKDFLENLTSTQYGLLIEFVSTMPKLKHEIKHNCDKCNFLIEVTLEGINDFF